MGYISMYIKEHYVRRNIRRDLYERFIKWCGERSINICLEKALSILASNKAPNIGANIAPNIGISRTKPVTSTNEGYEWCRDKSKVRNLQNFLKWVDEKMGLIDWWEEDNGYCFKTREKPSKAQ
jgi:hypothetical protein